jgi:hypothetical protein
LATLKPQPLGAFTTTKRDRMNQEQRYQNGYKIHPISICDGLVLREEMFFTEEQEQPFKYHVAQWVKGEGYEVLYYTGDLGEALRIYCTTAKLIQLKKMDNK